VSTGGLRFLGNDQVVLMSGDNDTVPRVLGYPALVKVRLSSADILPNIPWQLALWTQVDDAHPGVAPQTAVFAPRDLYGAIGSAIGAEGRMRAVVFYQQARALDELTCVDASSNADSLWKDIAVLPLDKAYRPNLMTLTSAVIPDNRRIIPESTRWPEDTKIFIVTCGAQRLVNLGKLIAGIANGMPSV
jgi:hypothetical protein